MKQMKLLTLVSILFISHSIFAQAKDVRMFIFGHSLINHAIPINEVPSQETSVPHWMHFLSEETNNSFAVSGQYGFLPQHSQLPPTAQWGFDFVAPVWESDYESFSDADFTHILITPGNFIQWQAPEEDYINDVISPVAATNNIFDWCSEQEDNLQFYVYENWPDMAGFLGNGFPPTANEWEQYNTYLQGDFKQWFLDYYDLVKEEHQEACVKMIPVGSLISELLQTTTFNEIEISELYEDDAPHGRPTIYFMAAAITYMAVYEERPPQDFQTTEFITPVIGEQYNNMIDFFWDKLLAYKDDQGISKVFCADPVNTTEELGNASAIKISPNPSYGFFTIQGLNSNSTIELMNTNGQIMERKNTLGDEMQFDIEGIENGVYFLRISAHIDGMYSMHRIVKQE